MLAHVLGMVVVGASDHSLQRRAWQSGRACEGAPHQLRPAPAPYPPPAADNNSGRSSSSGQTTPGGSAVPPGAQTPPLSGEPGSKPPKYEPQLSLIPYCNTKTIHFIRHG